MWSLAYISIFKPSCLPKRAFISTTVPSSLTIELAKNLVRSSGEVVTKTKSAYDKSWWWVKNIPSFVKINFPNTEFRNSDMIRVAHIPGIENDEYRKEVRYALSVALRECVENDVLMSRKEPGIKGYFYKKK